MQTLHINTQETKLDFKSLYNTRYVGLQLPIAYTSEHVVPSVYEDSSIQPLTKRHQGISNKKCKPKLNKLLHCLVFYNLNELYLCE